MPKGCGRLRTLAGREEFFAQQSRAKNKFDFFTITMANSEKRRQIHEHIS